MAEGGSGARLDVPWARSAAACAIREVVLHAGLAPLMDWWTRRRVVGQEHLRGVRAPVVFVANHQSHMDTPAILRALPGAWRRRTAVAAAADYFYRKRRVAAAVSLIFSTVPIERGGAGAAGRPTVHLDRLVADEWSLLLYAEGTRSRDGRVGRLRSGAAVFAAEHGLPIVPICVTGTHDAMPAGQRWMQRAPGGPWGRRHPIEIRFGAPIHPRPGDGPAETMERVRRFLAAAGAPTTPAAAAPQPVEKTERVAVVHGGPTLLA